MQVLFVVSVLSPVAAFAQAGKTAPTTATYIMKEDIDKVGSCWSIRSGRLLSGKAESGPLPGPSPSSLSGGAGIQTLIRFVRNVKGLTTKKPDAERA